MSDLMLHGVLNMPLPDDPSQMGVVEWFQFRDRARQASVEIAALAARVVALEAALRPFSDAAGELFARNYNSGDPVFIDDNVVVLFARQFFEARAALHPAPVSAANDGETA